MHKYPRKLFTISMVLLLTCFHAGVAGAETECVILLHGLARSENSLLKLERNLRKQGFNVVNIGYPSREKNIQRLSVETINLAIAECTKVNATKIHFVTHSMGGILVRYFLDVNKLPNLGRVVMLSPPNQGSEVVDKLKDFELFKWINGPAGQQLGTDKESLPNKISPPDYEVGVITGDRTINPILSLIIPGEDDGKVSVKRAKLMGMKDFLVVHKAHPFIMNDENVINQVIYFIRNGIFEKDLSRTNS
ncbi:MAG: alpha/beta hydrolase [Desulfobulbaceae bacterium]|nr:alpha/beta hydrolase [Desulfobulbaceae bacterium]